MIHLWIATVPVVLLVVFFYVKDKLEKEPPKEMAKAFAGGILSAISVILIFLIFGFDLPDPSNPETTQTATAAVISSFNMAFFAAAIPEEFFKLLFLYIFIWKSRHFNEYYDGILYAVLTSLGFAWLENVFYVMEGGIGTGIARALFAVPGHALDGVLMGYFFSHARFDIKNRNKYLLLSFAAPVMAHGIYDFIVFMLGGMHIPDVVKGILVLLFLGFVIFLWVYCLKKCKEHMERKVVTQN